MLESIFIRVLDMSKTAAIVIAVVLVARLLLKKAPKWISYALWAVVLLRLICPVSIEAPVSVVPRMEQVSVERVDEVLPKFEFETPADRQTNTVEWENIPAGETASVVGKSVKPTQWLSLIWLAGIAAMLVYSVVSYIRLRRKLVGAVPLRDNIYLADRISTPFVTGLVRPKIYLPSSIGEREQEYIILHEQRHIRRLDHVMKLLAFAALCLHWFNPLVWLAFVLAGKDMEMSCDEAVIKTLGVEIRADYSTSLLGLATGRRLIAGTPLAFGEGDTKGRIKNLAKWKKPVIWVVIIAVLICGVLAVCLLTDPVDKGDTIELVERQSGDRITAQFAIDIGSEVKSGQIAAELWQNGECVQSTPATFTKFIEEISLFVTPVKGEEKYEYVDVQISTNQYNGSVLTRFELPEYGSRGLGWATMGRELNKKTKLQPETAKILLAVAFDMGGGVRALDCETLEAEPERLKKYECILVIIAGFSSEDTAPQVTAEMNEGTVTEVLQLHQVIKLAEKGYELGWADFEDFYYIETGSGLYIRVYEIDETFSLHIGGGSPNSDTEPMYIYLSANGLDNRIDIRDGGVEEFIAANEGKPAKLSDEKIAELRELYPADTDSYAVYMAELLENSAGLAVVTVADEVEYRGGMGYLPVWINEVIYGEGMPEKNTEAELWLGNAQLITSDHGDMGVPAGKRYLCFIYLHESHGYSASKAGIAYLTADGYIMPATAEGPFAEYEGWSVETFLSACGITDKTNDTPVLDDSCLGSMNAIRAEWITQISGGNNEDKEQWAKAMNAAADNVVERSESIKYFWNVDVYSDTEETFRFYAGLEENIVMMYYHWDKAAYGTYFFEDKTLYELIRGSFTYEGIVDQNSLAEYENIVATRAEGMIRDYNRNGYGKLTGYELTEFCKYDGFRNGKYDYNIYRCNVAFIPEDPDDVTWAGGMWLDSDLRVRDYDLYTYLVIRAANGEYADHKFMFYDIYNGAGTDEERSRAWSEIINAYRRDAIPQEGTFEREMYDVMQVFFKEVYDIDEDCDIAKLFLDENDPYIEYCKEKNKLYFGIGKIYDDPLIFAATEVEAEQTEISEAGNGNYTVDTSFVLYVTNESSPDVVGTAAFYATFVFTDTADGCKIVSVSTDDDMDRVLARTTAEEQLQLLREELEWAQSEKKVQELQDFINTQPNNGFIAANFYENIWEADLYQLIYQCTDDSVSYEEVSAAYEAEIGEVYTDITYISGKNLDKLLKKLTGYGLDDKPWNFGSTQYLESIDVYCVMHGDTNFDPMVCSGVSADGDIITAFFRRSQYDYDAGAYYIEVTLRKLGKGEYQFISCKQLS